MVRIMNQSLDRDKYRHGSWKEFEQWIRFQIGSDFRWHLSPLDSEILRKDVVETMKSDLIRNEGVFPERNAFFEKI